MKKRAIYLSATLATVSLACSAGAAQPEKLTDYVNPNIGTAHSRWFFYTPAALPFGMAKPAPSTDAHLGSKGGWQANGYDGRHTSIEGFANFHEFQVGGVVMAPTTGVLQTIPGALDDPDGGYRSRFDKADEYATAGYYSVVLKDYRIKAELTATKRVALHRYTFPASRQSHIIFDIGNRQGESGVVRDAKVSYTSDGRVEGYIITYPDYVKKYQKDGDVKMYFSAVADKTPYQWGIFYKDKTSAGLREAVGSGAGLYLTFDTAEGEAVTVKVGLSYTSIENARLNMAAEAAALTFDKAKEAAIGTWNETLSKITVEGGTRDDRVKFYTGFFHAMLGRGLASDVNGAYPANDGSVKQIPLDKRGRPIHNHYNTDAIWGGYWSLTQLWALICPEYYADWIQSQLLVYKDSGWLGDGIASSRFVSGVGTNFTGLAFAAAYACGITGFDERLAYEAALKNETQWRGRPDGAGKIDLKNFVEKGYSYYAQALTADSSRFAASHVLEYSFSSWAVAQMAQAMGHDGDYKTLMRQSENWRNIYDPSVGMFRPRNTKGEFISEFNPLNPRHGFQEGNALQYSFYVPHTPEVLVDLIGKERFNHRLDSIFTVSQKNIFGGGTSVHAFAGLSAPYNQGNQPCLYIPWMFNFSGKPHLTQKWVRAICDEFYGTEEVHGYGYGQDEDQGQLGAWYVISSIGLFDVRGLTAPSPEFQIGSPLFDRVTITMPTGRKFVIRTVGNSKENVYIESVTIDSRRDTSLRISYRKVVEGGEMVLIMSNKPSESI